MGRKIAIALLALGALGGFGAGFARLLHHGHHGHHAHGRFGHHSEFERRVAQTCTEAALRVYERERSKGATP
jgi:hypothetical protein